MTDLATRLVDAAYDAREEEFYRVSPFDVYRRQARAATIAVLDTIVEEWRQPMVRSRDVVFDALRELRYGNE